MVNTAATLYCRFQSKNSAMFRKGRQYIHLSKFCSELTAYVITEAIMKCVIIALFFSEQTVYVYTILTFFCCWQNRTKMIIINQYKHRRKGKKCGDQILKMAIIRQRNVGTESVSSSVSLRPAAVFHGERKHFN